ncbi:patatin-like phospholipase RssA [Magnetovibrio blakemorei]|uniref:PNPLA domain-containing protein n=1 Tax=Magnetovibrio blakemorei TaxID=28181 RepID=A0A1E5Q700_9PROT|nr:patatin-like phospholipase RssA [Magnetovibrio blakemorei]OEJ66823.1 hypothetical protein BEN30_11340 [Magnetovibrio blakemorei]
MNARTPMIGLALGSGSARGWAHIGVIEALAEINIHPSIVCGTSIGALVGAAQAVGELQSLRDWVLTIGLQDIIRLMDFSPSSGGLIQGNRLLEFFNDKYADVAIETLSTPYAAVATELASGREVWLREGSLMNAVRASIAMPGLFSPMQVDGRWLVDGGLVNPVPVSVCRALGAEIIIAVNLNGDLVGHRSQIPKALDVDANKAAETAGTLEKIMSAFPDQVKNMAQQYFIDNFNSSKDAPGYFDILSGSINIMQDLITRSRMAGDPPDLILSPRLSHIGLLEFNRAEEAIEEGRRCVRQALPRLQEIVGCRL